MNWFRQNKSPRSRCSFQLCARRPDKEGTYTWSCSETRTHICPLAATVTQDSVYLSRIAVGIYLVLLIYSEYIHARYFTRQYAPTLQLARGGEISDTTGASYQRERRTLRGGRGRPFTQHSLADQPKACTTRISQDVSGVLLSICSII